MEGFRMDGLPGRMSRVHTFAAPRAYDAFMPATLHSFFLAIRPSGRKVAIGACAAAAAATGAFLAVEKMAAEPPTLEALVTARPARQLSPQDLCVEGALMTYDVQWAAACSRLAESGQSDGYAECDLPPQESERINQQLQQAERQCAADWARVR
ncbi:hypothetical protein [Ramlibacter humi]|uniref:UrcA family protein n=1 Tax=Ramlibacter humi TaxID=2530451 RepID=A0A4Z0BGY7_9BURK|nr:hypothetical protein [Ramlibacter humi]TFY97733.1 hypothetical protein EZ216_18630 [Ramlibacter humi]